MPTALLPGSGASPNSSGAKNLTIAIDTPVVGALVNVGDSILVVMHLHGSTALRSATVQGLTFAGSADLGTLTRTVRYAPSLAPVAGTFRPGLKDTTVRRYIKPVSAADTTLDSVLVQVVVLDSAGNKDSTTRRVDLVAGPRVTILTPANGDSTPAGIGLSVATRAQHPNGIASLTIRVTGETSWPTKLDTSITQTVSGAPRDISFPSVTVRIPANAPVRGRVTVSAKALDVTGQPGTAAPVSVFVRNAAAAQPLVNQVVAQRSEIGDSITVTAHGDGITSLGYVARTRSGAVGARDSIILSQPYAGNATARISLKQIPVALQGQKLTITSFAVDQAGRTGYAVRPSQLSPEGVLANATVDSTLIVYGHTYALPDSRNSGLVGDLIWDAPREQVVLSNQVFNRLEVFHATSKSFDASGIAVGSFPWGLFVSNDPGVLLVANSGGTNLSRVDLAGLREIDGQRIRTRITPLYTLTEDATGARIDTIPKTDTSAAKIDTTPPVFHEGITDPVLFSDRPQYVGQLKNGKVYFSTRPTTDAPKGTIRFFDPTQAFPDLHPIIVFKKASASIKSHVVADADFAGVTSGAPGSDFVTICDHEPGTDKASVCATTNQGYQATIAALQVLLPHADVTIHDGVDITDAGLTDTTYVAVSGDRNWIAFGSGNTAGSGNIFMSSATGFDSPPISQIDLTNNASERINGLALDSFGFTVAAHGTQSFFASVDDPFHLRLQGKYPNAAPGQGIVLHPLANASQGNVERTAYVASGNATVEILDIFHYLNRGTLPIKANLYGPLRAALRAPSDAPDIVLKLFGVSAAGLVVIDLRAGDIIPSP
ncbi:MAG TPA: hypothetical protein VK636_00390 [Gemmatimonadaceae bacterium]|nr:hypothetical protein [Gemmatimonadaceae bacterium]